MYAQGPVQAVKLQSQFGHTAVPENESFYAAINPFPAVRASWQTAVRRAISLRHTSFHEQ